MGHIRLGRLPKTYNWKKVIEALLDPNASITDIVSLTSKASQQILTDSKYIEGLAHCYWIFTNIAQASRSDNFVNSLNEIGIKLSEEDSGISILKKIFDYASSGLAKSGHISILDHIAIDTFKSTIHEAIIQESTSLFGCDINSIQRAFKKYSTSKQVSYLSREFFSQYMFKAFSFALEKELANSIKSDGRFQNSQDIQEFNRRLKTYCWDVSKILEEFSGGWYGKHSFEGDIKIKKKVVNFTKYAMEKLLSEIRQEAS